MGKKRKARYEKKGWCSPALTFESCLSVVWDSGPLLCRTFANGYTFGPPLKKGSWVSYLPCICADDWRYTWALAVHSLFCAEGGFFSCGIVLGWCWLTTRHPPKCLLTPTPQQDGAGKKRKWKRSCVETKTARSLTNHRHGQNRLNLGKICLLSIQIDLNYEKLRQRPKYLPLHPHLSPRLNITPSFPTLPPCLLLESSTFVFCNKITSSQVWSQARR